LLTSRLARLK